MNQSETVAMMENLKRGGFCVVPFEGQADVYVINSCTVTGKSDYRSRQLARRAFRTNVDALVVLAGCYPQASPEDAAHLKGVDLVLGNREKLRLSEQLRAFLECYGLQKRPFGDPVIEVGEMDHVDKDSAALFAPSRLRGVQAGASPWKQRWSRFGRSSPKDFAKSF
jgi:tRNA A37 methylthiotransferase MiaB